MSWALNCGSPSMPAGMRENDLPHGPEADEPRDECFGCGERECLCGEDDIDGTLEEVTTCWVCGSSVAKCKCELFDIEEIDLDDLDPA